MPRILVIDDAKTMRDTLRDLLTANGFEVVEAENGEQGLEKMGEHAIDLVISDLNMPGMDGLTMCGHMKEQGYKAPIFMLTTQTSPELKAKAKAAAGRDDLKWHDLRHTGATLAAQVGATTAELQARLGHSTSVAAQLYQHAAKDRDRQIAERLSQMLAEQD